ncbi:S49 family peptidase [Noviherbaspirillum cavernae]|uniref:S49 family peptidase n=1 Tax=Noviherbaspirillum cavernae TaxID=2320862 RepID=A0A418X1E3_9BURK|nr:S49 family peptidase [Noviherbaspirillum cavernae]RJG06256.1 S49 family peptidase [Noviherbaspirillum cavernae]
MKKAYLAELIFNTPLAIHGSKLEIILNVLQAHLNIAEIGAMEDDELPASLNAAKSGPAFQDVGHGVAVLPIYGSLTHRTRGLDAMSGIQSYKQLSADFHAMVNDGSVRHIVLDLNTPGGSVNGLFDLADEISSARGIKPISAIVDESAYSAGYAIASAADEIIVPRMGGVGSIGVIAAHVDRSAMLANSGIKVTPIYAGARKADGLPDSPLTDEALSRLQAEVDRAYELFVETVAKNRGMTAAAVRATEADTYRGDDAIRIGLADKVMTAKDALRDIIARNVNTQPQGKAGGRVQRAAQAMQIIGAQQNPSGSPRGV